MTKTTTVRRIGSKQNDFLVALSCFTKLARGGEEELTAQRLNRSGAAKSRRRVEVEAVGLPDIGAIYDEKGEHGGRCEITGRRSI